MDDAARIELTFSLWRAGADDTFDEYVERLVALLPRNRGVLERRAAPVDAGPGEPDALLVMSFPDSVSVDGFLRDPERAALEDLATAALARALISDSRHRPVPDEETTADILDLRPPEPQ